MEKFVGEKYNFQQYNNDITDLMFFVIYIVLLQWYYNF